MSVRTGTVAVDGGELRYDELGEGRPVVLVHEGIADRNMWDGVWETLAERYRTIRYDMRGWGESSVPQAPFAPYRDLQTLVRSLDAAPAALVGMSFGGGVVVEAVLDDPSLAWALAPMATSAGLTGPDEAFRARSQEADTVGEAGDLDQAVEIELQLWVDGHGRPGPLDPAQRERARQMNLGAWRKAVEATDDFLERLDPPPAGRLGEIAVPTLVAACEYDAPWLNEGCAALAAGIPGARFERIDGVAHLATVERPDEVARLLRTFLDAV